MTTVYIASVFDDAAPSGVGDEYEGNEAQMAEFLAKQTGSPSVAESLLSSSLTRWGPDATIRPAHYELQHERGSTHIQVVGGTREEIDSFLDEQQRIS